jgi:hypothetical protein
MDRFKDDFARIKEIEQTVSDNLKERAKCVKAGTSTTKVISV